MPPAQYANQSLLHTLLRIRSVAGQQQHGSTQPLVLLAKELLEARVGACWLHLASALVLTSTHILVSPRTGLSLHVASPDRHATIIAAHSGRGAMRRTSSRVPPGPTRPHQALSSPTRPCRLPPVVWRIVRSRRLTPAARDSPVALPSMVAGLHLLL